MKGFTHTINILTILILFSFGLTLHTQTVSAQTAPNTVAPYPTVPLGNGSQNVNNKSITSTLYGNSKTCPYLENKGLYMPFSNIDTNFALFKNALNIETRQGTNCIKIAGSTDRFIFVVFRIFIGICSVLAVIYISIAGITMIVSQANPDKKRSAKKMLMGALKGLLLAVGAWVLLYTVNNRLVEFSFDEAVKNTNFEKTIDQGKRQAAANVQNISTAQANANFMGSIMAGVPGNGTAPFLGPITAGNIDPRNESIQFAKSGGLNTVRDSRGNPITYTEDGYTPIEVNGKTFYVGKVSTFGGPSDENQNSDAKLGVDSTMTERDLDTENDQYISARWNYGMVGPSGLRDFDVEVVNLQTKQSIILQAQNGVAVKDWGPHPQAGSNADFDVSKKVLRDIGVPDGGQIAVRLIPKN